MATYTFNTLTQLNLTLAGTPQTIVGSSTLVTRAYFSADDANTGKVYIFKSGKALADGIPIAPGETFELSIYQDSQDIDTFDLADLRFDGDTTGNDLGVSYFTA